MERATAEQVEKLMRKVSAQIDESVRVVMNGCRPEEFQKYRRLAGQLMGTILLDIRQPIFEAHPDLTPRELRQDGKDYSARN
jgi:hypothetical protein